jgi:hypothetical protein
VLNPELALTKFSILLEVECPLADGKGIWMAPPPLLYLWGFCHPPLCK